MSKNLNKVRDMSHAKYYRLLEGDEIQLRRIALMYNDLNPKLMENTVFVQGEGWIKDGTYALVFKVEISMWKQMVKDLGLVKAENSYQNRNWRIA